MTYEEPLCGECRAARASLEIVALRRGKVRERRLMCIECARGFERLTFGDAPGVGLVELVAHVAERQAERAGASSKAGCPVCGRAADEVLTSGSPGCATCYLRFASELDEMISAVHGAVVHRGKGPAG